MIAFWVMVLVSFSAQANSVVGTWELESVGCENPDKSITGQTGLGYMFTYFMTSTMQFGEDGSFVTAASIPGACKVSIAGEYEVQSVDGKDFLAFSLLSAIRRDGKIFGCPGEAPDQLDYRSEFYVEGDILYFYEMEDVHGRSRCEEGAKAIQVLRRVVR